MDVCTTRHWQKSGRLVKELNAKTLRAVTLRPYAIVALTGLPYTALRTGDLPP